MNSEERLEKMTGTKITSSEFEYLQQIAEEKKWSIAQVIREIIRESMKQEVAATA